MILFLLNPVPSASFHGSFESARRGAAGLARGGRVVAIAVLEPFDLPHLVREVELLEVLVERLAPALRVLAVLRRLGRLGGLVGGGGGGRPGDVADVGRAAVEGVL